MKTVDANDWILQMKKNFFPLVALMLLAVMSAICVGGCSTPWGTIRDNISNSRDLRVGMTKSEVLAIMGEPIRDESFCKPDIWYYYIEMVWGDGLMTEDECMPLVFEDGLLIGWGNDFYVSHRLKRKNAPPVHNPEPEKPVEKQQKPGDGAKTTPKSDAAPTEPVEKQQKPEDGAKTTPKSVAAPAKPAVKNSESQQTAEPADTSPAPTAP